MRPWTLTTAAAVLLAAPAMADPLWDMCHGPGHRGPEQCDCVVETVKKQFAGPDLVVYEALAARYLSALDAGKGQADAWNLALEEENAARGGNYVTFAARAQELARRHEEINTQCGG